MPTLSRSPSTWGLEHGDRRSDIGMGHSFAGRTPHLAVVSVVVTNTQPRLFPVRHGRTRASSSFAPGSSADCGGAILHDRELTYSIVLPSGSWPKENFLDHVADVHDEIRLATCGLAFVGKESHEAAVEPFLCFERRSSLDLVNQGCKIVGSAQRKRTGALLQHGSILLGTSSLTPHLAATDGASESMLDKIVAEVTEGLMRRWNIDPLSIERTTQEVEQAHELAESKYRSDTWNRRR